MKHLLMVAVCTASWMVGHVAPLRNWETNSCVVFLGASITDFGWYVPYVQMGLACRMPELKIKVLKAFGAFDAPSSVRIADGKLETVQATAANLKCEETTLSFEYTPKKLPFPMDANYAELAVCSSLPDELNREMLTVSGLASGRYTLKANGEVLLSCSAHDLEKGVNIATLETPNQLQAQKLLPLMEAFSASTVPLRKIAAAKMIASQEGANLNDIATVDKSLDAWLAKCKQPPAHAYAGRKQMVEVYRKNRDQLSELEHRQEILRSQMIALATPQTVELMIERIGDEPIVFDVGPQGNDANPGTYKKPFASLAVARDMVF